VYTGVVRPRNRLSVYTGVVTRTTANVLSGELELPLAFANTLDVEEARDELGNAESLRIWLLGHHLIDSETRVSRRDLGLAIELRDALRRTLLAHSGMPLLSQELAIVNEVLARLPLDVQIDASGEPRVVARGEGVTAALGRVVCDVAKARTLGTWDRLKLCPAEDCLWAFFDSSKNRSRRWCSMNVCGNRTKTRTYRRRRAANAANEPG
jgi:predicted RNA-binding Zn ribbon-like protein